MKNKLTLPPPKEGYFHESFEVKGEKYIVQMVNTVDDKVVIMQSSTRQFYNTTIQHLKEKLWADQKKI